MKPISLKINKKILFEFISISFAVFLGLMLNQWKENHSNKSLAEQSLNNIRIEIDDNVNRIDNILESHEQALAHIDSVLNLQNDTTKINVDIQIVLISSTAWEAAKLTQAIAHINIEKVSDIAMIYTFQEYYESIVKEYILNNINRDTSLSDIKQARKMKTFLEAIIPMEKNLIIHYNELLTETLN